MKNKKTDDALTNRARAAKWLSYATAAICTIISGIVTHDLASTVAVAIISFCASAIIWCTVVCFVTTLGGKR